MEEGSFKTPRKPPIVDKAGAGSVKRLAGTVLSSSIKNNNTTVNHCNNVSNRYRPSLQTTTPYWPTRSSRASWRRYKTTVAAKNLSMSVQTELSISSVSVGLTRVDYRRQKLECSSNRPSPVAKLSLILETQDLPACGNSERMYDSGQREATPAGHVVDGEKYSA
jgi:hypothetical protein